MPSFFKKRIMKRVSLGTLLPARPGNRFVTAVLHSNRAADDQKFNRVCPEYRTKV